MLAAFTYTAPLHQDPADCPPAGRPAAGCRRATSARTRTRRRTSSNLAVSPSGPAVAGVEPEHGRGGERQGALRHVGDRRLGPDRGRQRAAATTTPVAAIGDDGSVVATWEHFTAGGKPRARPACAPREQPACGAPSVPLSAVHRQRRDRRRSRATASATSRPSARPTTAPTIRCCSRSTTPPRRSWRRSPSR